MENRQEGTRLEAGDRLGLQLCVFGFISVCLAFSLPWRRGGTGPVLLQLGSQLTKLPLHRPCPIGGGDPVLLRFTSQKAFVSSDQSSALVLPL